MWYEPDARARVDGEVERQPRVFVSAVRTPRLAQGIPVLALDGTGSLALNQRIFGEHLSGERFAVPRDAEVWQVTSKTFSRQSITGTDRRGNPISLKKMSEAARLRRQVRDLLKLLPGNILLVTYRAAEEVLRPDLPPNVQTAHFGALRGLNSYEHCETVVVIGREQPSAQAIEALTRPCCATDAEPFIEIGEYVAICSTVAPPSGRFSISIIWACLVPARGGGFSSAAAFSGLGDFALAAFALAFPLAGAAAALASVAGAAASIARAPASADVTAVSASVAPSEVSFRISNLRLDFRAVVWMA